MATASPLDWRHWILSHLIWVVAVLSIWIMSSAWIKQHDAALQAQAETKVAEAQITNLKQQISTRDSVAAQQIAPIVKIIHDTTTPQQAARNLPQVVTAPLPVPTVAQQDGSLLVPVPDVLPLFNQVADDKVCRIELAAAQADVTDEKAIVTQQQGVITDLKKKPKFWSRVKSTAKVIGVAFGLGVGIGLAVK